MQRFRRLMGTQPPEAPYKPEPEPSPPEPPPIEEAPDLAAQITTLAEKVEALGEHIVRSAKEQFRTNALIENALTKAHEVITTAQTVLERQKANSRPMPLQAQAGQASEARLLQALMPVLDGIEAGLESGYAQLERLQDIEARKVLHGWLDGQRVLRERLLALLEREHIRPIPAVGERFDPYLHVVVETVYDATREPGIIVEERLRGYELEGRILRFAKVVVTSDRFS